MSVRKVLRKLLGSYKIRDVMKGNWLVRQDFHGNFWVNITW